MAGTHSRFQNGGKAGMQPRRRRKKIKQPKGHPSDAELIAAYLENNKVTKCPAGYAMGSLNSSCFGLDG